MCRLLLIPALIHFLFLAEPAVAQTFRSTKYNGTLQAYYQYGPNANYDKTLAMTIEAWVYRDDENRCETIVSPEFSQSYWLEFCGNHLRSIEVAVVRPDSSV